MTFEDKETLHVILQNLASVTGKLDVVASKLEAATKANEDLKDEIAEQRKELLPAATNRDYYHKSLVHRLVLGSALLNLLFVVWFTGIQPKFSPQGGVEFHNSKSVLSDAK